jgi:hypothetical protein
VYEDAKKYYYSKYMTNLQNSQKNLEEYKPKVINITIEPKKREPMRRRKFISVEEDNIVE